MFSSPTSSISNLLAASQLSIDLKTVTSPPVTRSLLARMLVRLSSSRLGQSTLNRSEDRDLSPRDEVTAGQDAGEAVQLQVGPVNAGTHQGEVPLDKVQTQRRDRFIATIGGKLVPGDNLVLPGSQRDIP